LGAVKHKRGLSLHEKERHAARRRSATHHVNIEKDEFERGKKRPGRGVRGHPEGEGGGEEIFCRGKGSAERGGGANPMERGIVEKL